MTSIEKEIVDLRQEMIQIMKNIFDEQENKEFYCSVVESTCTEKCLIMVQANVCGYKIEIGGRTIYQPVVSQYWFHYVHGFRFFKNEKTFPSFASFEIHPDGTLIPASDSPAIQNMKTLGKIADKINNKTIFQRFMMKNLLEEREKEKHLTFQKK